MAGKSNFSKSQVAREELDKSPNAETQTIARKLCRKYPEIWPTVELARTAVRYVRGSMGKKHRVNATHSRPIQLPKPDTSGWASHELPSNVKQWLIISDIHAPYYNRKALKLTLEFGRSEGCDGVLINGDLTDYYQASRFEKDPRKRNVAGEIECTKRILDQIQNVGANTIIYKEGNHDARLASYFMQRCPELFEVIDKHCNLDVLLGLSQRGIKWIHDRHTLTHRELTIVHGHEWGRGVFNPVNPARGAFLRAIDNVLQGHCHRTSDHTESTLRNLMVSCWSTGCLCELNPMYQPIANRWNHGFAVLTTGANWAVRNYRIVNERKIA